MAGLASLIYLARLNSAEGDIGETLTLPTIAAVVIGGTSLFGGVGSLFGTFIGGLILTLILNGMNLLNLNANWQPLVTGLIVLLAVWLDMKTRSNNGQQLTRIKLKRYKRERNDEESLATIDLDADALPASPAPAFADGETVAVFTKNQTNPFFESVRVGTANAAKAARREGHSIRADQARQHSGTDSARLKTPSSRSRVRCCSRRSTTRRWCRRSRR